MAKPTTSTRTKGKNTGLHLPRKSKPKVTKRKYNPETDACTPGKRKR